jgi:hypothetical protein
VARCRCRVMLAAMLLSHARDGVKATWPQCDVDAGENGAKVTWPQCDVDAKSC